MDILLGESKVHDIDDVCLLAHSHQKVIRFDIAM